MEKQMKKMTSIILILMLVACDNENSNSTSKQSIKPVGTFVGTLGEKKYQVEVKCSYFKEDYFIFRSDSNDAEDSTGDGLVISGDQNKDSLAISIGDHDKWFSIGKIERWTKNDSGVVGSGNLWEQGGSGGLVPLKFSIACE